MFPLRDENRSDRFPVITVLLIAANALVFAYQFSLGEAGAQDFILRFGAIPQDLVYGIRLPYSTQPAPYWTLLTSLFLHANLVHLLGNMWFLWIFGDNIEAFLGRFRFLVFYLVCGVLASATHILLNCGSSIPMIGASGAISGVLGAYLVIYPRVRIRTLILLGFFIDIVHIPAIFFLGFWFLLNFLGGLNPTETDVAFAAHVGGFLAGMGIVLVSSRRAPSDFSPYRTAPRRLPRWK